MQSVSPSEKDFSIGDVAEGSDADDEKMEGEMIGEECERIALPREGGEVKKLVDPLLPSKEQVEEHWIRGHVPYRNWCEVCVRAKGREMGHFEKKGKERLVPE